MPITLGNTDITSSDGTVSVAGTGSIKVPSGTTAQRPASPIIGMVRYNTTLSALENYTAEGWFRVSVPIPNLTSIDGNIYNGQATTLTINGTTFGTAAGTVRFISGATTSNVTVTPSSSTLITVTVPSAIFNLTTGDVVSIQFINSDNGVSNSINKTIASLPTGGTITTSGSYRIHTYTSSSSFVVPSGLTLSNVEYLVIAGGGAGGADRAGGGGAGGYRTSVVGASSGGSSAAESRLTLTAGTYTVTVGGGGTGSANDSVSGASGANSVFSTITSTGGGGGGGENSAKTAGGSGGGGGYNNAGDGSGTSGQGTSGANGVSSPRTAGGGGGSGASGSSVNGGAGLSNSITGSAVTRAGGGGGGDCRDGTGGSGPGVGGSGGGGAGGVGMNSTGGTGSINTGSGGGGGGFFDDSPGGSGGSGLVIVRYII